MAQQTADRQTLADRPPWMSYETFLAWVPDGGQAEWVDGEAFVSTTSERHVRLSRLLVNLLSSFLAMLKLGEVFAAPFQMRVRPDGPGREPDVLVPRAVHLDRVQRHWTEDRRTSSSSSCRARASRRTGSSRSASTERPGCRST